MQDPSHIDVLLFGGLVLVGLVLVGVLSLFAFRKVPSVESLAKKFKMSHEEPSSGDVFLLRGTHDDLNVTLRQHEGPLGDYWTSWEFKLPQKSELWLSLMRRSWSDRLADVVARSGGGATECVEVTSPEASFNENFCVVSDTPEASLELLNEELQDLLTVAPELASVVVSREVVRVSSLGLPTAKELDLLRELALTIIHRVTVDSDSAEGG